MPRLGSVLALALATPACGPGGDGARPSSDSGFVEADGGSSPDRGPDRPRPLLEDARPHALVLDDDRLLMVGELNANMFALRFDLDGRLDPSFGNDGLVQLDLRGPRRPDIPQLTRNHDSAGTIWIEGPHRYLAGQGLGYAGGQRGNIAVARLFANGERDPSFGLQGVSVFLSEAWTRAEQVRVDASGRVYVIGTLELPASRRRNHLALRLTARGELDPSFRSSPTSAGVIVDTTDDDAGVFATLDDDRLRFGGGSDFALVAVDLDGQLDADFGIDGVFRHRPGRAEAGLRVGDDVLLAGIDRQTGGGPYVKLVCASPDGVLTACPGTASVNRIVPPGEPEAVRGLFVDEADRVTVFVTLDAADRAQPWILRLRPDGEPDEAWGPGGWRPWSVPLAPHPAAAPARAGACAVPTPDGPRFCGFSVDPALTRFGAVVGGPDDASGR